MKQNEKRTPHYKLEKIKDLINKNNYCITRIAVENARNDFNIKSTDIPAFIMQLDNAKFYKSMTSEHSHKIWQDVYHKSINKMQIAYIKLQMLDNETVIIQFKQK